MKQSSDKKLKTSASSEKIFSLGKINWFGGYNRQTERQNEYGFISGPFGDVYFHQSHALAPPEYMTSDAEVIFQQVEGARGKPAAIMVQVTSHLSDIELVNLIGDPAALSHEDKLALAVHRNSLTPCESEILESVSDLSSKPAVPSVLRQFWKKFPPSSPQDPFYQYAPAALQEEIRIDFLSDDELVALIKDPGSRLPEEILNICLRRNELSPCESEILEAILAVSSDTSSSDVLARFWRKFTPTDPRDKFFKYAPKVIKDKLISALSDAELVSLIQDTDNFISEEILGFALLRDEVSPCDDNILAVVADMTVKSDSSESLELFWRKFPPTDTKNQFYRYAPREIKKKVCREYFSEFNKRLNSIFSSIKKYAISLPAESVYATLDAQDKAIAKCWAGRDDAYDPVQAKMLSARAAEKAATKFYENVGLTVEDIAIKQLDGGGGDWTTHDLLINSSTAVDVKNSRRPVNGKKFYVEHTVPRFKTDRMNAHVRIAGVLSPYLNLKYIQEPNEAGFKIDDLIFLGETGRDSLTRLGALFNSPTFEVSRFNDRMVPHWLFSYPSAWYGKFSEDLLQLIGGCEWPEGEEWNYALDRTARLAAIPALCVAGRPLPEVIAAELAPWQQKFFERLQGLFHDVPDLPTIFLAILTDFLEKLKSDEDDYSPVGYQLILFTEPPVEDETSYPLGAIDPLGIVGGLIETLTTLWRHRDKANLRNLQNFRFIGSGILQGRERDSFGWKTIIAYCGGTAYQKDDDGDVLFNADGKPSSEKGKCGNAPLVIGDSENCTACGKLVCDKCGHCSPKCEDRRLAEMAERARVKAEQSFGATSSHGTGSEPPIWEEIPFDAYADDFSRRWR